jgi:hypothetical protein
VVEVRAQEKDRAKERFAKLRADFNTMLIECCLAVSRILESPVLRVLDRSAHCFFPSPIGLHVVALTDAVDMRHMKRTAWLLLRNSGPWIPTIILLRRLRAPS